MSYQMKETSAVKICRIKFIPLKEIKIILENNYNGRLKVPGWIITVIKNSWDIEI